MPSDMAKRRRVRELVDRARQLTTHLDGLLDEMDTMLESEASYEDHEEKERK